MATLVEATAPADLESVRELFVEYARGVDEPCCFTSFDAEVAALPHGYFALLLAKEGAAAAGCVGLRRLDGRTAYEVVHSIDQPLTMLRTESATLEDAYLRLLAAEDA